MATRKTKPRKAACKPATFEHEATRVYRDAVLAELGPKASAFDKAQVEELCSFYDRALGFRGAGEVLSELRMTRAVRELEKCLRVGRFNSRISDAEARVKAFADDDDQPGDFERVPLKAVGGRGFDVRRMKEKKK